MKLFKIEQSVNDDYDTYDAAIVAAPDEDAARNILPGNGEWNKPDGTWCDRPDQVEVTYIGEAKEGTEQGVILESFNAG
jgi:hypothetical protein